METKKQHPIRLNLSRLVEVSGLSKPRIYSAVEDGQLTRNQDGTFTVSGRRNQKFLRELGIDPSTLYRKMKALEIEAPAQDGRSHP